MAFTKIPRSGGRLRVGRCTAIRTTKGRVLLVLSADFADPIGLKIGASCEILLGSGTDAGFVMVRAAENGRTIQQRGKSKRTPVVQFPADFGQTLHIQAPTNLPWRVKDGALVIDINPILPKETRKLGARGGRERAS
jgi:hypothetical protein